MERALGKGTAWGILLLCALIVASSVLSYRNLRVLRDDMRRTEHAREALSAVEEVVSLTKDLETSSRGFAITGDDNYLAPYTAAEKTLPGKLAKTKQLFAGRTDEAAAIAALEDGVRKKQAWARDLIAARRERGLEAAQAMMLTLKGKRQMDAVRATLREIDEREAQHLAHWSEEADASYRTALISLFNVAAGGLVLVGAIYYLVRREAVQRQLDLTERNRAAETISNLNRELQQHVHELETLLELMPIGIAIAKDPECKDISTNPACAELLGLARGVNASLSARDSQRPKNFRVLRDGVELAANELPMQRAVATGQPVVADEVEIVRNDGVTLKLLEYVAPLFHDDGRVRGGVGVFVDVTERTRLAEQLRGHAEYLENQQHWLQSLLDLLPVPLLLIEPLTGRVTFANRAAHDMADGSFPLGEAADRYEQLYYSTDLSGFRIPPDRMPAMRVAKGERLERYELVWHLPRGDRSLLINADSLPAMHGQKPVAVLIFQDITAIKQVETELRRTNQAKDAMLAMLGHELRNPLAAITGSADVVATHSPEDPAYQTALEILKRHITHLTRLIDDMLDLARLTTDKIRLRLERVDLLQPLNHALQAAQTLIESRNHALRVDLPQTPVYLHADRARLEQVFTNLLMNAAKYTEPGGRIELRAHMADNHAVVAIRDNGIGINPEVIPKLFDLFAQVKPSLDRSQAGLGIGLTVVRNLVDLHGGDVEANSAGAGKGSEFVVRLPLASTQTVDEPAPPQPATKFARTLKVLVVEDNPDIAHVLVALIIRCGHEATWAAAGPEALDAVSRSMPDIGLLDIGLPGMNGYELAIELKKNPRFDGVPLVALTGFGQQEDRIRSEEAGFMRHLVKPVSLETLEEVFRVCVR